MRARLIALGATATAVLVAPSTALALNINESYQPQNEFKLDPWIPINVFGIDMSINKAVFYVVAACILACGTLIWVSRRMQMKPNRIQAIVEVYYDLVSNITRGNLSGAMVNRWFPFMAALFLFLWFSNMIGYLPLPTNTEHMVTIFGITVPSLALYAATANISVPLALTLMVVISYHIEGIRAKGPVSYVKGWVPAGVTGVAAVPIFFIEVISQFVRIISLSVRLFANILAGHLLILFMGGGLVVLLNLAIVGSVVLGLVTGTLAVAFYIFEVGLVATLQAFIFTTLSAIYLGGAVAEEH
ncbi:MAG: F0F1 ATP synthase subunit A [Solirubrobacteraceae bacterium]|nr:F0F1 ATP synthase subunit A [Solirubrobacteraceae bacterium]